MKWASAGIIIAGIGAAATWTLLATGACDSEPESPILLNFHVLADGRAYRSAQLSAEGLAWVIDTYGIRTVVNLRGENLGEPWYDAEAAVCREKGVRLADHRMSMKALPPPDVLRAAIDTLKTAEYPILIHCQGGADRTGMMSAIYRMAILGDERKDALTELSPECWHFRNRAPCMDVLAEMYEPTPEWLDQYARDFENLTCEAPTSEPADSE